MIKLLDFMRKHKVCTLLLSILIFAIPLIVVHLLYKMDCKVIWLQTKWSAGDVLSYVAGFEAFIGTVALGFLALWQNHTIQEQHIESQEPLLSMNLVENNSMLYLVVENTGGVEAKDISLKVLNIYNNGGNDELCLDGLFGTVFELYPKEKVKGRIAFSGESISTEIFPQIRLSVSYTRPDLNRKREYERTVVYNNEFENSASSSENNVSKNIASDVDKIARANVRIANYLDGHQVAKFDELNILANRSLRNDLVEAIKTQQEVSICGRTETIYESFEKSSQEDNSNG